MDRNIQGLQDAVDRAVRSGERELAQLERSVETVLSRFRSATASDADQSGRLVADLTQFCADFDTDVRGHLGSQCKRLATFNIAFFGRTGAGKSTLLSAFGQLDGEYVSPGESDWTTGVTEVEWQGCSLWDTPGINGWGRTHKRAELEETARRAVEIADVVLLCFDNQSQQASEFGKVAQWVQAYGKPVIAVLNVRNLRWRHPAKVNSQSARRSLSRAVAEHAGNIKTELSKIDLGSTPVVAIQSRRALFARAKTPFAGPAATDFAADRDQFGCEYLAEWSNFAALEDLIAASITEGGSELRQTSLREGLRAIFDSRASTLDGLSEQIGPQIRTVEDRIAQLFDTLGYLEGDQREQDLGVDGRLIAVVEQARGGPFTATSTGALARHFEHLLQSHMSPVREATLRRADGLVSKAIADNTPITDAEFKAVYSASDLQTAVEEIWAAKRGFVQREIEMAVSEFAPQVTDTQSTGASFDAISATNSRAGMALQSAGLAAGAAAGVIAVPSVAAFWNPVGWVGATAAVGLGVVAQASKFTGSKLAKRGENDRATARAAIERESRSAVRDTFDSIEKSLREQSASETWTVAAPVLITLLKHDLALRRAADEIAKLIDVLQIHSNGIAHSFAGPDVLDRAARNVLNARGVPSSRPADLWLGENWFEYTDERSAQQAELAGIHAPVFAEQRDTERRQLSEWLARIWSVTSQRAVLDWLDSVTAAVVGDGPLAEAVAEVRKSQQKKPSVVILGDYSSGKSSLVKRLLVEMSGSVPDDLQVRGSVATSAARVYELDHVRIVDTPGFQSGRAEHDEEALKAAGGAALIVVVLHVNLLIGDMSLLESIVKGTERSVPNEGRILYLINRSDELGTDPTSAPDDYLLRRRRKADELIAALESRGIEVHPSEVHLLAGDPFGEVGGRVDVTRADFDSNRDWDGVEPLVRALDTFSSKQSQAARARETVDGTSNVLLRRWSELRRDVIALESESADLENAIQAVTNGERDAELLEMSMRNRLRRIVEPHAGNARSRIRGAGKDDMSMLGEVTEAWLQDDQLIADLDRYCAQAAQDINDWYAKHESAIGRQMKSSGKSEAAPLKTQSSFVGPDEASNAGAVVAGTANSTAKVAKAIGNRDAIYSIGKSLNVKFKPWGAVKAGGRVAKAAPILAAVGVAADAHSMYRNRQAGDAREAARTNALAFVARSAQAVEDQILNGVDDDGPLAALHERTTVLTEHRVDLESELTKVADTLGASFAQIEALTGLLADSRELFSRDEVAP